MTTAPTPTLEQPDREATERRGVRASASRAPRRFAIAAAVGFVAVSVPFLWILWDLWTGTLNPTRQLPPDDFYDLQARAMFHGHLHLPKGSIGIEAFVHGGHDYTYFGLFPSLLRMPVLAVTHSFDGKLTAPSMLLAWLVTGLFTSLLLWRVRVLVRGNALLGRAEAAAYGALVAAVCGSVLFYLAASPKVSHEDLAWSVALTVGVLFALLGVLERPTRGRALASGLLVLAAGLDRGSTGYACVLAAVLVAAWFGAGLGGREQRRWALPLLAVGMVPLAVMLAVNEAKFGHLFGFDEADQVWTHVNAHRAYFLSVNGGSSFGLRFLPSTLTAYLQPSGLHVSSVFPYLSLPTAPARTVGNVVLDQTYPTASITASMPVLFLLGVWGLVSAFRPHAAGRVRLTCVLLIAAAGAASGVLLFGYIAERYLADFLPFLALAGIVGLVDIWRRLAASSRAVRGTALGVIGFVALFGIWANIGAAITPTALWTPAQAKSFVSTQHSISGTSVGSLVEQGHVLPYWAPAGTLFATDHCTALYVSTGFSYATVPGQQLQHETWDAVQQGPGSNHTLNVTFDRPVHAGDAPVTLMTYGPTSLVLVPVGTNRVRMALEGPGVGSPAWPASSTSVQTVRPGKHYTVTVMTDPYLTSIVANGIGNGIEHHLPGSGPAVVQSTAPTNGSTSPASVVGVSKPSGSPSLCRSLVKAASS